jgi:hypothetical protein
MTDNKPVKVKKVSPQDFAKEYQELCEELGYRIVVVPSYIARDDGTFSTQLQYSVGELPKKQG